MAGMDVSSPSSASFTVPVKVKERPYTGNKTSQAVDGADTSPQFSASGSLLRTTALLPLFSVASADDRSGVSSDTETKNGSVPEEKNNFIAYINASSMNEDIGVNSAGVNAVLGLRNLPLLNAPGNMAISWMSIGDDRQFEVGMDLSNLNISYSYDYLFDETKINALIGFQY